MTFLEQEAILEAVLFVAGAPLHLKALAAAISQDMPTTKALLSGLGEKYTAHNRGLFLLEMDGAYQLSTNPKFFEYIQKAYAVEDKKPLSPALLETLAIVAYKQPITKGQIEEIRGVNADHAVNRLLACGLVTEKGRQDAPGKPILFGTTEDFLKHFGLKSLKDLPVIREAVPLEAGQMTIENFNQLHNFE